MHPNPKGAGIVKNFIHRAREAKQSRLNAKTQPTTSEKEGEEEEDQEEFPEDDDTEDPSTVKRIVETNQSNDMISPMIAPSNLETNNSNSNLDLKPTFKADRVCRLSINVNCCDFVGY